MLSLTRDAFQQALQKHLSPTTPIRSAEHLRGRERKLEDIRRSMVQPGRHIFVYGDRGVGKTSLAQTAAFEHHPTALGCPIFLGCESGSTFLRVAHEIIAKVSGSDPRITKYTDQRKGSLGWKGLGAEVQKVTELSPFPTPLSVNEAVDMLGHLVRHTSSPPVIVVDEFERVTESGERALFADFIKQVGDQTLPIKLIFCGVGAALEELLDTHHSCYRYLTALGLERLPLSPLLDVIDTASKSVSLEVDDTTRYRIAKISDGFPHYVHLIVEKLLWEVFESNIIQNRTIPENYLRAIKAAVRDIEPHLRARYEKATLKYSDEYEAILWAVADHHELKRRSSDIYESYVQIMHSQARAALQRERFNTRMNALKRPSHGPMLKATRQGWYEFEEAVSRGYVRLRAEERGIQLGKEHPLENRRAMRRLTA